MGKKRDDSIEEEDLRSILGLSRGLGLCRGFIRMRTEDTADNGLIGHQQLCWKGAKWTGQIKGVGFG